MFFEFKVGPDGVHVNEQPQPTPEQMEQELPEYIQGPEGELIINRKDLLLSKTESEESPSEEEISKVYVLTNHGWLKYQQVHRL